MADKNQVVHELIAEHSKLSEKDVKALYKTYNVTFRDIPKILFNDPAIAHLDAKDGDVIKIKRKSRTAGETTFYRGVIKE